MGCPCLEEPTLLGAIYELMTRKKFNQSEINEAGCNQSSIRRAKQAGRQGFGLSAIERKAVEMRAMDMTRDYLVSWAAPSRMYQQMTCDFLASRKEKLMVEVKSSTTNS